MHRILGYHSELIGLLESNSTTGAIALRIAYGYQLCEGPEHDPFLEAFETMGTNFFTSAAVGACLADTIPICKCLESVVDLDPRGAE